MSKLSVFREEAVKLRNQVRKMSERMLVLEKDE